jgi:cytochrome c oxidase subunit 3
MNKYNLNLFFITYSPWPILSSLNLIFLTFNLICFFSYNFNIHIILLNFIVLFIIFFSWWSDVITESSFRGFHNKYIIKITTFRIIIFIISEIFFFIRFFWTFFHFLFSPDIIIGIIWPCSGILIINFLNLPLLNSILLLRRGCFVTWSHYKILRKKLISSKLRLLFTIILGIIFILCQIFEYKNSPFSFSDRCFGSIFFIATGFHGLHVLIGSLFLFFILIRINRIHFSNNHLIGFEFSIWYWHFVDVVWLYLYLIVYWLGG